MLVTQVKPETLYSVSSALAEQANSSASDPSPRELRFTPRLPSVAVVRYGGCLGGNLCIVPGTLAGSGLLRRLALIHAWRISGRPDSLGIIPSLVRDLFFTPHAV